MIASVALAMGCDDASSGGGGGGTGGVTGGAGPAGGAGPLGGAGTGGMTGGAVGGSVLTICTGDDECPDEQYCLIANDALQGACTVGCRILAGGADNCPEGEFCDGSGVTQTCMPDPCTAENEDTLCGADEWCDLSDGACKPGCRVGDDSTCPPDEDTGRTFRCVESHGCEPVFPCCAEDATCSETTEAECTGTVLHDAENALTCEVDGRSVCESEGCPNGADDECPDGTYCNATDTLCYPGCRQGMPETCGVGQICDEKNRCVDFTCADDGECPDGQYCDVEGGGVCRAGCRDDSECPDGACDMATRACGAAPCDGDAACGDGSYCDEATSVCRPVCEGHADCDAGEFCDGDGRCQVGCADDDDEDNDDLESAVAIELGAADAEGFRRGGVEGRVACDGDPDFWSLALEQGERMRVVVTFDDAAGNITVKLHGDDCTLFGADDEGNCLGQSPLDEWNDAASPKIIEFPFEVGRRVNAQDYVLEVQAPGLAADASVGYSISVTVVDTLVGCFPDAEEPNDELGSAGDLRAGRTEFNGLSICADDEDWFCGAFGANDGVDVTVTAAPGAGPLALELLSATRVAQVGGLGQPNFGGDDVTAEEVNGRMIYSFARDLNSGSFSDEDWCVRVRGATADDLADYDIVITHDSGAQCGNDGGTEPNDDRATAVDLSQFAGINGAGQLNTDADLEVPLDTSICVDDEDLFCTQLEEADVLEAWIVGEGIAGALSVQILDPANAVVGREARHTAPGAEVDKASLVGAVAGEYCVRVDGVGQAQGDYTLFLRREVVVGLCGADRDEVGGARNDTAGEAISLPDVSGNGTRFEWQTGRVCDVDGSDDDWYSFPVTEARSSVCVMASGFDNGVTDINTQLFDVQRDAQAPACVDDEACAGGAACVGGRCMASTDFGGGAADFEVIALTPSEVGARTGDYLVRVRHSDANESGYRLAVTVAPETSCADQGGEDWQEAGGRNNERADATFLGGGEIGLCDAWVCSDEGGSVSGDWYTFTLPAGAARTVHLEFGANVQGPLGMEYFCGLEDEADEFSDLVESRLLGGSNYQCLNAVSAVPEDRECFVHVFANGAFIGGGDRIDYTLRIVDTDLGASDVGECNILSNSNRDACPPRAEWDNFGGFVLQPDNCWATHTTNL